MRLSEIAIRPATRIRSQVEDPSGQRSDRTARASSKKPYSFETMSLIGFPDVETFNFDGLRVSGEWDHVLSAIGLAKNKDGSR